MNKFFAGLAVAGCAAAVSLVGVGSAEAYPDANPSGVQVNSSTVSTQTQSQAPASAGLPSTGGPDALLLAGGGVLLLVGGVSVAAARRRQES